MHQQMALEEIALDLTPERELPARVTRIIDESDTHIDRLFSTGENRRIPKYIPSDPALFYRALEFITDRDLPLGRVFCEWGSGFGVCACLAAELGYESYGIEIDPGLAAASQEFIKALGAGVRILETSYVPDGYESYSGIGGEYLIKDDHLSATPATVVSELSYEGMNHDIADIDVFFVYPWPMEQEFMQDLFDEIAVEGAILVTYHKAGEICAFRKTAEGGVFED